MGFALVYVRVRRAGMRDAVLSADLSADANMPAEGTHHYPAAPAPSPSSSCADRYAWFADGGGSHPA